MKKGIFAILFHMTSAEQPKYVHCPLGKKSWCFWQRAVSDSKTPGSHKCHETIPTDVEKKLVPIFQRLSMKIFQKVLLGTRLKTPMNTYIMSFGNIVEMLNLLVRSTLSVLHEFFLSLNLKQML